MIDPEAEYDQNPVMVTQNTHNLKRIKMTHVKVHKLKIIQLQV